MKIGNFIDNENRKRGVRRQAGRLAFLAAVLIPSEREGAHTALAFVDEQRAADRRGATLWA